MQLTIPETPGRCRWCRCTHERPCPEGCGWANRTKTLCTACVAFDAALRTFKGREQVAALVQDHGLPKL